MTQLKHLPCTVALWLKLRIDIVIANYNYIPLTHCHLMSNNNFMRFYKLCLQFTALEDLIGRLSSLLRLLCHIDFGQRPLMHLITCKTDHL